MPKSKHYPHWEVINSFANGEMSLSQAKQHINHLRNTNSKLPNKAITKALSMYDRDKAMWDKIIKDNHQTYLITSKIKQSNEQNQTTPSTIGQ